MLKKNLLIVIASVCVLFSHVHAGISYSGWVRDTLGRPVPGASVVLYGDSMSAVSAADGSFLLQGVPLSVLPVNNNVRQDVNLKISGRRISLNAYSNEARPLSVSLYDIRGRRIAVSHGSGNLCEMLLTKSSGFFVIHVRAGRIVKNLPVTVINGKALERKNISLSFRPSGVNTNSAVSPALVSNGGGYRIISASSPAFFTAYTSHIDDTASGIVITLPDSSAFTGKELFRNPSAPIDARVRDLLSRMTIQEKVGQLLHEAPAIKRLGIIEYNWWNECLHGVGVSYLATVFPQAIGMAAAWDTALIHRISTVISDEARAKHRREIEEYGKVRQMRGLTFFSPNINIFRDPRWGRGQETYGEDPYLTSRIAVSFIKGLQGEDSTCLKTSATAKHYAVHSGPEELRHVFNVEPSWRDFLDTYLPAFRVAVKEADVRSVMCAYNQVSGTYACRNDGLLNGILRREWGFKGFVVSDCGAKVSLAAGCDLICTAGWDGQDTFSTQDYDYLIDSAAYRLMRVRFELGMFDPPSLVPYASIPYGVVDCEKHRQLARETAQKSMVLLKNNGILPLKDTLKNIAVIGPHADWEQVQWGNYYGTPSYTITPFKGIRSKAGSGTKVSYSQGCMVTDSIPGGFAAAESLARTSDVVIVCCGLTSESGGGSNPIENENHDRDSLGLPGVQDKLVRRLIATGKPVILVLINGGPVTVNFADSTAAGIVEAWYGGQEAGRALADVLFGTVNFSGKMPVTVYKSESDLPEFTDYEMELGRTYRYFLGEPLYPFGYGLSYTTFSCANLNVWSDHYSTDEDTIHAEVDVTNTGLLAGDEIVQLYIKTPAAGGSDPRHSLKGFARVHLNPNETRKVTFLLTSRDFSRIYDDGNRVIEPGNYSLYAGGGQPGTKNYNGSTSDIFLNGQIRVLDF